MDVLINTYLGIGIVCGIVGFFKMLTSMPPSMLHFVAALIATALIVVFWPFWLTLALVGAR